jgi:hypothetical protein
VKFKNHSTVISNYITGEKEFDRSIKKILIEKKKFKKVFVTLKKSLCFIRISFSLFFFFLHLMKNILLLSVIFPNS